MFTASELQTQIGLDISKYRFEYYNPSHLQNASLRDIDKQLINSFEINFIDEKHIDGLTFTALYGNTVIMIVGVYPLWTGVADIFMVATTHLHDHKFHFHRTTQRFLRYSAIKLKLWRYQCYVCALNVLAIKWIEACYFTNEGRLKKFGPDKLDYFIYGRVFE